MSLDDELGEFGHRIGADTTRFANEGKQELAEHAKEHPQPLFALLRTVKPVLLIHDIAIVTRYPDVVEVLTNDEAFSVEPYMRTMKELAGDFILGLDDGPQYERDISILRLAAPRSDMPALASFVAQAAEALVDEAVARDGRVDVADLARRVPARLVGRWFGTPGPDEDSLIAWTLSLFEDIFVNVQHDPKIHEAAQSASKQLRAYLDGAIAARKAIPAGTDVLGRLLAMQANDASAFTDEEIATSIFGMVVGFIPTISTATTFALDVLLDRPEPLAAAQQAAKDGDIDTVRTYMWEAMRLAPQGPGLLRQARSDFVVAAGTLHETRIPAGTVTFAATESAMLDGDVVNDPDDFRVGRPANDYLHFGAGLHECFGRFANAMQIPLIATAILSRPNLARVPGPEGKLVKDGPFAKSLVVDVGA